MSTYFPIKTATACQLKWTWSTIRLYHGNTSSCHRVGADPITPDTFENFHNTPKKQADRQLMLAGEWPSGGCEYCSSIEKIGGSSDRMLHLKIPNLVPPELDLDPMAIQVTPRIVEVYFDNFCNMACVYCHDGFSSRIQQENLRFGRFERDGVIIDNGSVGGVDKAALTRMFWRWMETNCGQIHRLIVLGGEPFVQPQFEEYIDFFETHPCPHVELNAVSNLKVPQSKFREILDHIKDLVRRRHLKRFDLTASVDCFGPEQEYVRFGLDLDQWRTNFQAVVDDYRFITLNINQTLSCLTIKTVPALLRYINQQRTKRKIGHFFSLTVDTHDFLHPDIFGPGFFTQDFADILREMPDDARQDQEARAYMQGISLRVDSAKRNDLAIGRLGVFLDEIDRRRDLDWRKTFPWLATEIDHVV